ncbi:hypothetical protein F6X53_05485 [Methylobacterium soli]|uniref:Uncharacterized protein n=1 Tax=Methylobacterium soli TaxID=553447 RepID=A0A6L3T5M1_9HYPH|nr:hypothetical protein F6X53_05485 [Methylobacterium soli]
MLWDAGGEDTYVPFEINASSVFPLPEEAPDDLVAYRQAEVELWGPVATVARASSHATDAEGLAKQPFPFRPRRQAKGPSAAPAYTADECRAWLRVAE